MSLGDHSFGTYDRNRLTTFAFAIAIVAAVYLSAGLLVLLPASGYERTRLAFVALVVAIAWGGVAGAVFDRPPVVIVAAVALLLLGFWQAVFWIFMLPAALGLAVAGVLLAHAG